MKKIYFIFLLLMLFPFALSAEVIYLKDGQVVNGAIINEDTASITVKTKYETKRILRASIQRILFGERQMETQYILMKNGDVIKGFLVDQDSKKVIIRDEKKSKRERILYKSDIKQMSREEISPLFPDMTLRIGLFYPFNSGGSKGEYTMFYGAGSSINFPWIENMRVYFELGFIRSTASDTVAPFNELYLIMVPLTASFTYRIPAGFIEIVPKLGGGLSVTSFNNGEGKTFTGADGVLSAGTGLIYPIIKRTLYLSLWSEYTLFIEKSTMLHSMILSGSVSYRF